MFLNRLYISSFYWFSISSYIMSIILFPLKEPFANHHCDLGNSLILNLETVNKQRKPASLNPEKANYKYDSSTPFMVNRIHTIHALFD